MSRQHRHGFPAGTELVFGPLAARQRQLSAIVAGVMHGWGFTELILPSFDHAETFKGSAAERDLYHFTDRKGQQLTLRADFTRLAAKALAPLLTDNTERICATYEGKVFRSQAAGHHNCVEQSQRGLEWINAQGREYDAAILMIVREILKETGLLDSRVVVGHAGFIHSILGECGRADARLLEAIDHKNPTRIRDLAEENGMDRDSVELLAKLPSLTGDVEVLNSAEGLKLPDAAKTSINELREIYNMLEQVGQHDHIMFDLGEVRRFHYYSGFMFKLYHKHVGSELGGGGRYDRLFEQYGYDAPAVGFGVDIGLLAQAIGDDAISDQPTMVSGSGVDILKAAIEARKTGQIDFGGSA
ncbi:ATP phosphoribosyltransferase regulatory subunit [Planctomycetota bacterium]|nr:ATP phosphoribosyltransferase regulatory subunit [Planctomycetota bacterium]